MARSQLRRGTRLVAPVAVFSLLVATGCSDSAMGKSKPDSQYQRIALIEPSTGPTAGGTDVTLRLDPFAALAFGPNATATFGGQPAKLVLSTPEALIVTAPAGQPGPVDIKVTLNGPGTFELAVKDGFTYTGPGGGGGGGGGGNPPPPPPPGQGFLFINGTDKWYVVVDDPQFCDADRDGTPDFEQVLQFAADNTGGQGAFSGKLLEATDKVISWTTQLYGNNPDGTLKANGVRISFQRALPQQGAAPTPGQSDTPNSPLDYNVMAFHHIGGNGSTTGQAILDASGDNARLEHNFRIQPNDGLGIFVDRKVDFWNSGGIPNSKRSLENFTRIVAGTLAHECGHSLGLQHSTEAPAAPATDNIMAPVSIVDPDVVMGFSNRIMNLLRSFMPGAGRCTHVTGYAPKAMLAQSNLVVIGRATALADGQLQLEVEQVVAGEGSTGTLVPGAALSVRGWNTGRALDAAALAELGTGMWFLCADEAGASFVGGEADVISLESHDRAEWTALVRDYAAIAAMDDRDARREAYAARLTLSLGSSDRRISAGALAELAFDRDAARSLSPEAALSVADQFGTVEASRGTRVLAAMALVHRADPALVGAALGVGLGSDDASMIEQAAGVLESTLGLAAAADLVKQSLTDANRSNAVVLLGALLDGSSRELIQAELAGDDSRAVRAADALGQIADAAALPALQGLALDAARSERVRLHALRAIGRIGGEAATSWLDAQESTLGESARFARDFAGTWMLE